MFGCCNTLFSSCCRGGCGCRCAGFTPQPMPPMPPVTPPSPPRLRGMQLSLVGSSGGTVDAGHPVSFDAVNTNNTLGVSYTPGSGSVTLSKTGTYLVNWWVAVENAQTAEALIFATSQNGSDVQSSYSDIGGGQVYGTAIINVTSVPTTLQLINRSSAEVTYVTAAGQAGMTITQFA